VFEDCLEGNARLIYGRQNRWRIRIQAIRLAEPASGTTAVAANQRQIFRDTAQLNLATAQGRNCNCESSKQEGCVAASRRGDLRCVFLESHPKNLSKDVVALQTEPSKMSKTKTDSLRRVGQ
jgi:hypothetical protein